MSTKKKIIVKKTERDLLTEVVKFYKGQQNEIVVACTKRLNNEELSVAHFIATPVDAFAKVDSTVVHPTTKDELIQSRLDVLEKEVKGLTALLNLFLKGAPHGNLEPD